jgi:gentisate 1,2-dioxygenase
MFVTPSWAAVSHEADDDADLFLLSDRPVLEALGLARTALAGPALAGPGVAGPGVAAHAAGEL